MLQLSSADHGTNPPTIHIPSDYNAAYDLIERNLRAGRANKIAYYDADGAYTYGQLAERVDRFADAISSACPRTMWSFPLPNCRSLTVWATD